MKKTYLLICICILGSVVFAEIQPIISYQGKLTDIGGVGLNGTRNMVFRVYNSETSGIPLWGELHPNVPIENGLFDVLLGSNVDLDLDFSEQYWLEIEIGGDVLIPRVRLTPSPYALRAVVADSIAGLAGITDNDWEVDGDVVYTLPARSVGIGTAYPGAKLHVVGDAWVDGDLNISGGVFDGAGYGTADQVLMSDGFGDVYWGNTGAAISHWSTLGGDIYRETGYVGIGTDSPTKELHVVGDAMVDGDIFVTGGIHDGVTHGDAGHVLTSDGAGNILWADPPTGLWNSSAGGDTVFLLGSSIGVGTGSPLGAMHIVGDFYSDGRVISQDTALGSSIIIDGTVIPGTITEAHGKLSFDHDTLVTMGRIGVGTDSPTQKLEVIGNTKTNQVHLASSGTSGWENQIAWFASDRTTLNHVLFMDPSDGSKLKLDLGYSGAPVDKIFSFTNGSVGFGTSDPTEQIHLTHNIRVDGSFSDGISVGDTNQIIVADGVGSWVWQNFEVSHLIDIDTAGVVDGQVLKWVAVAGEWRPSNDVGGATGADNWGTQVVMSDSSLIGDGTAGDKLGIDWDTLDAHISRYVDLNDLHNVNDVGVVDGEVLAWIAAANEWRPLVIGPGGLGDNWGTQITETDASLHGDGTAGDLLSVNWDTLNAYPDTLLLLNDLKDVDIDSLDEYSILGWDHEDSLWRPHYDDDGDMNNELIDSVVWEPADSADTVFRTLRIIEHSVDWNVEIPVNQDSLENNSVFELADVDTTGLAEGYLMRWTFIETSFVGDDTTLVYKWQPINLEEMLDEHQIGDFGDVSDSVPVTGDVMQWLGTEWGPGIDVEDIINVWEDFHGYIAPLTENTSDLRVYDNDSSRAVTLIETTGVATSTWYGMFVDRRGVAASDGYGIYAHGGTDGGISAGSEFYGVKGKASGGSKVYGLYGDGDYPGVGGTGYGLYARGKTYGVYGYGTGTNSYGVYAHGESYGVYARGETYGVYAHSDDGWAGYFHGDGYFHGMVEIADDDRPAGSQFLLIGDDAYITDIDQDNHMGFYGLHDSTIVSLRLGADGPTLTGKGSKLGIGTSDPDVKLHVRGGSDASLTGGGYLVLGDIGGDNLVIDNNEIMARDNGSASELYIQKDGGNTILNDGSGNVGIGTGSPDATLDVKGTVKMFGDWTKITKEVTGTYAATYCSTWTYTATTDLHLVVYIDINGSCEEGHVNIESPVGTLRARASVDWCPSANGTHIEFATASCPVRKGDTYRIHVCKDCWSCDAPIAVYISTLPLGHD